MVELNELDENASWTTESTLYGASKVMDTQSPSIVFANTLKNLDIMLQQI